jgi:hypothetical protein
MKLKAVIVVFLLSAMVAILAIGGCAGSDRPEVQTRPVYQAEEVQSQPDSATEPPAMPRRPSDLTVAPEPDINWGWIKHEWINVRSKPTTKSEIVVKLQRGDKVRLVEHAGDWWQVKLASDSIAYIYASLVFDEPYVDPWTTFRMGCRRADSVLAVIVAITRYSEEDDVSAYLSVADVWYDYSESQRRQVSRAAYSYWLDCLEQSGHRTEGAAVIIRDDIGKGIVRVSGSREAPKLKLLD